MSDNEDRSAKLEDRSDAEKVVKALRERAAKLAKYHGDPEAGEDDAALADFVEAAAKPTWRCGGCGAEFDAPCSSHPTHHAECGGDCRSCPVECGPVSLVSDAALARLREVLS